MEHPQSRSVDLPQSGGHAAYLSQRSRSDEIPSVAPVPSLKDVSFLAGTAPHITLSPAPRLPLPQKPQRGQLRRPSTASSAEEKYTLLPSSSAGDTAPSLSSASSGSQEGERIRMNSESPLSETSIQEVNRKAHQAVAGLRAEASKLAGGGEYFHFIHPCIHGSF